MSAAADLLTLISNATFGCAPRLRHSSPLQQLHCSCSAASLNEAVPPLASLRVLDIRQENASSSSTLAFMDVTLSRGENAAGSTLPRYAPCNNIIRVLATTQDGDRTVPSVVATPQGYILRVALCGQPGGEGPGSSASLWSGKPLIGMRGGLRAMHYDGTIAAARSHHSSSHRCFASPSSPPSTEPPRTAATPAALIDRLARRGCMGA